MWFCNRRQKEKRINPPSSYHNETAWSNSLLKNTPSILAPSTVFTTTTNLATTTATTSTTTNTTHITIAPAATTQDSSATQIIANPTSYMLTTSPLKGIGNLSSGSLQAINSSLASVNSGQVAVKMDES